MTSELKNTLTDSDQLVLDAGLMDGIKEMNLGMAQALLERGADPNARDDEGYTALFYAAFRQHPAMVKLLMDRGATIREDGSLYEALKHAATHYDLKTVQLLVEAGVDVNSEQERGYSALEAVLDTRRYTDDPENGYKTARYLVSKGADVTLSGVLTKAAYCGDPKLIELLLDAGSDINAPAQNGTTPLMAAVERARRHYDCQRESEKRNGKDMVDLLLSHGADAALMQAGDTVLSSALSTTTPDKDLIEILVKSNCPIREKDVIRAAKTGDFGIFRLLYSPDLAMGYGALLVSAAKGGNVDIISIIMENETIHPEIRDYFSPALGAAAELGHLDAVNVFLSKNVTMATCTATYDRPVIVAAGENGHTDVVLRLIEAGADMETVDTYGKTVLNAAVEKNHTDLVRILLEKGADVNACDKDNESLLLKAGSRGYSDLVTLLLDKGADVHLKDKSGKTAVDWAMQGRHYDVLGSLIEHGADLRDISGDTVKLFENLIQSGRSDTVLKLVEKDGGHGSALIAAITQEDEGLFTQMVEHGDFSESIINHALIRACERSSERCIPWVERLITLGANPGFAFPGGYSALMVAARNRSEYSVDLVKRLLDRQVNPNTHTVEGQSILMVAVKSGNPEVVRLLLNHGANPNYQHKATEWGKYRSILGENVLIGMAGGFKKPLRFLSAMKKAYSNCRVFGDTALLIATGDSCKASDDDRHAIINMLIDKKANVHARDTHENTPLILAAGHGSPDDVAVLLKAGADIHTANQMGHNALRAAAWRGNTAVVDFLLGKRANPNEIPEGYEDSDSALVIAVKENHTDIVTSLLNHGAKPDEAAPWARRHEIKLLFKKYEETGTISTPSEDELSIQDIIERERQKKAIEDAELAERNKIIYPEGALCFTFIDPFGEPMEGYVIEVEYDGKKETKTADKEGTIFFLNVRDKKSILIHDRFGNREIRPYD